MVGQNFRPKRPSPLEGQKPILKVELSEDEASGEETLAVTYPGRRRRAGATRPADAAVSGRKVRFDGDRKPLKSALKKSPNSSSSDITLVDTSDEEDLPFSDSSDDIDTSEDDAPIRQRKGKLKRGKAGLCKKADLNESSAAKDALPHPTCACDECVKGRKILKAVIKFEAKVKTAEKATEDQCKGKTKGKRKSKKEKAQGTSDTDGDPTDADSTEEEEKASPRGMKNKKQKQKQKIFPREKTSSPMTDLPNKAVDKRLFKVPQYPTEMKPNLIMRPQARVMQIEHALETPYDPRPNAFYDTEKGITRVYHGPHYANPNGKLYEQYNPGKPSTPRTYFGAPDGGTVQNSYAPWLAPGAPAQMPSFGLNPAMHTEMVNNEEVMRKAAGQGLGLSGLAPPLVPPYFKEMQKEAAQQAGWQKRGSDKGSKKGDAAWGATTGWGDDKNENSKHQTPEAKADAPADPSPDHNGPSGWGGGGGVDNAWGAGDFSSKKDGCASPHNFGGWGGNDQPEISFQRSKIFC